MANPVAWASGPDESTLDAAALIQLEQRADHAQPREQCYLYSKVLQALTESAGREMAAGQDALLVATLGQINTVMEKIQTTSAKDAKKLKDAEQAMERTQRRLSDMAHAATEGERSPLTSTLDRLGQLHTRVLALVFSQ